MRFNIPLLPYRIDVNVGRRPLRPLRMRSTVGELLLTVVIAALLFSAVAESTRLRNLGYYHATETRKLENRFPFKRPGSAYLASPEARWHAKLSNKYHNEANRKENRLGFAILGFAALVLQHGNGVSRSRGFAYTS